MIISELLAHIGFEIEEAPLEKLEKGLDAIKERLNLIIGFEAVTKLYELSERFAHWGEELHLTAENLGMTTESLQGLNYAAEKSGVSQEMLSTSLARLARQLYAAKTGSKEAQEQFAKAGISGEQITRFKTTEDALYGVSAALASVEDPIKRMAIAQQMLGRGGTRLIAFLGKGPAAIREEAAELKKPGLQLSGPQIGALVQVEHAFVKLHAVMHAIGAQIASFVAPTFTYLIDKFTELYGANKNVIGSGIHVWLTVLSNMLAYAGG